MYRLLTLLILLLLFQSSIAQPAIEWAKCYGGTGIEKGYSIVSTFDKGFIVAGSATSKDGDISSLHDSVIGNSDVWIIKLNSAGAIEWEKAFGGNGNDYAFAIIQTRDSGYAFAGSTKSSDGDVTSLHDTNADIWVVKINQLGVIEWQKTFGGSGYDEAYSIIETSDRGLALAGVTTSNDGDVKGFHLDSTNKSSGDVWILKLDRRGELEWQRTLGGTSYESVYSIIQSFDGSYLVAGFTTSSNGDVVGKSSKYEDFWIVKLNNTGSLAWQKTYGGEVYDVALSIVQSRDSGFVVAGFTNSYSGDIGSRDQSPGELWIIKINDTGRIEWKQGSTGNKETHATSIISTQDKGFAITGWKETGDGDTSNFWIVKLDSIGNLQWNKSVGGANYDKGFSIVQTLDGGYAITGITQSNDGDVTGFHGGADFWVVKLFPYTNPVSVKKSVLIGTNQISLFPNPNNGIGKIEYSLEKSSQIKIEVYDAIGRLIRTLLSGFEEAGIHEHDFDLLEFPSGQYFIRLQSDGLSVLRGFQLER